MNIIVVILVLVVVVEFLVLLGIAKAQRDLEIMAEQFLPVLEELCVRVEDLCQEAEIKECCVDNETLN